MDYQNLFQEIFSQVYGHEMTDSEADKAKADVIIRTLVCVYTKIYNSPKMSEVINGTTNVIHAQQPSTSQIRI